MPRTHRVEPVEPRELTLLDYLGWLRRRWWIIAIGSIVGLAAAAGFTATQPRTFTSETSVLVRQIGPEANPNAKVNLDTEAQVVRSMVVATRARDLLKTGESPESLLGKVTVTVPPNAQVLVVVFESGTPTLARDGSHAFAQAYLDLRVDIARRDLDTEIAALRLQIEEINKQLTAVAGKMAALPANSVDRQRAEADRSVLTNQLANLNGRLSPLLSAALDPGSIISDATLPVQPTSPNQLLNLASGFGAGLLLGIALALLMDRLDTRIRRGRNLTDRLGFPVLLELPGKTATAALLPPSDRVAREFGRLRNVLLTAVPQRPAGGRGRQLLICAATAGDATGFVVGNLAAAYARTGAQVAVVTTNVDSPLARIAGKETEPVGLADVLRREVPALQALTQVPSVPQLYLLHPGALDAEQELPVGGLREVLGELSRRFEHVLIETPPTAVAVEAQAVASHVDGVIVVVEARHSRNRDVVAAVEQFNQVDAPLLGAVLTAHIPPYGHAPPRFVGLRRRPRRSDGTRAGTATADLPGTEATAEPTDLEATVAVPTGRLDKPAPAAIKLPADATVVLPRLKPAPDNLDSLGGPDARGVDAPDARIAGELPRTGSGHATGASTDAVTRPPVLPVINGSAPVEPDAVNGGTAARDAGGRNGRRSKTYRSGNATDPAGASQGSGPAQDPG